MYPSCPVTLLPVNYFSKARNYAWIPAQHQDQNLHVMASRHLNNVRLASHGLDNQSNVQLVGNGKHTPSVLEESPIKRRGRGVQKQFWHAPPSDADGMVAPPPRRRRERRTSAEGHCTASTLLTCTSVSKKTQSKVVLAGSCCTR